MEPQTRNQLILVTAMKGAPLSILVCLMLAGRAMTGQELQTFTGYSADSVTRGLRKLSHLGAIIDLGRRAGWRLHPGWHQLELFRPQITSGKPVDNFPEEKFESENLGLNGDLNPKISDSNRDHDHDHDDDDPIVDKLLKLQPPFDHANAWIAAQNRALVNAWLNYLDALPDRTLQSLDNQSAFIRSKVSTGRWPPQPRKRKKAADYLPPDRRPLAP